MLRDVHIFYCHFLTNNQNSDLFFFFFCALLVHPLVIVAGLGHASVFDQDLGGQTYVGVSF